jgi:ATP/maltotriose-dependent transcriptional regulator MalT
VTLRKDVHGGASEGLLEIHVNPRSEEELRSLLVTVTSLIWRQDRERRIVEGEIDRPEWPPELSEREVEIVQLYAQGGNAESIATQLHLSAHTVRSHARNLRQKLRCSTISQAVAVAIMLGQVTPHTPADLEAEARGRSVLYEA